MLLNNTLREPVISSTLYYTRFITKFCLISHYNMCSSPYPPTFENIVLIIFGPWLKIHKNMQFFTLVLIKILILSS
jgi:hypothetical protein